MKRSPDIMCLPVSWPTGLGEYGRLATIARYGKLRWPDATFRFVLNRHARVTPPAEFDVVLLETSPTLDTPSVVSALERTRPDLVLFDNTGQSAQLRCARRVGARTVYLSTRSRQRRHGVVLSWLGLLDEHWIVDPPIGRRRPGAGSVGVTAFGTTDVRWLGSLFAPPDPARADALLDRLGLRDGGYVLFVAGGGGGVVEGRWSVDTFAESAGYVTRETGLPSVVLQGPQYAGPALDYPDVLVLDAMDHEHTVDLITHARLLVVGASSTSFQGLALRKVMVATRAGGEEQAARVQRWADHGVWEPSPPDPGSLSSKVVLLLRDRPRFETIEQRVRALNVGNGLTRVFRAMERLLPN